jgi:cation transporter-like permease
MGHNINTRNLKGEYGADYYADTSAHTGDWEAIQALEAAVAALVSTNVAGTLSAVPIPAGAIIFGRFTSITLSSGKVIAYRRDTYA